MSNQCWQHSYDGGDVCGEFWLSIFKHIMRICHWSLACWQLSACKANSLDLKCACAEKSVTLTWSQNACKWEMLMDHLHVRHCPQIPRLFAICSCCRRNLNVAGFLPLYSVISLGPTRQCLFQNKMSKRFDLNSLEAASFAQLSLRRLLLHQSHPAVQGY